MGRVGSNPTPGAKTLSWGLNSRFPTPTDTDSLFYSTKRAGSNIGFELQNDSFSTQNLKLIENPKGPAVSLVQKPI